MLYFRTKLTSAEFGNSMTVAKRYDAPIHCVSNKSQKVSMKIDEEAAPQMTLKSSFDKVPAYVLVPTLLVFEVRPIQGLLTDKPSKSAFERLIALRNASVSFY